MAEWVNAIAVVAAAIIASQTVRGYFERRAAERQSDLAARLLEAIYRFESTITQLRSVGEFLGALDAAKPYRSDFEISLQKIDAFERRLSGLETSYTALLDLLPLTQAVFGDEISRPLKYILHVYARIEAARYGIRQYNEHGRTMAGLGEEFTGWDLDGVKLDQERINYYWAILLDDKIDTAEVRKQIEQAKSEIEKKLLRTIRVPFRGSSSGWKL